mmetsp:Transcript_3677/g.3812  ORF Transcript_3677/g.3812 Transcript_3677/m.3812 type:complete len:183 (-) Transcript_3677:58-606(-)|eukprot:CAMPEP_0182416898 /NCGR_PEP_ID=MMETSP1167-20130531/1294_1 /TAXON_ID=2988 /ORGANISM="Mallomonas Sp, Strain CCMP3275" /LENGTH=182 /DNA_ID=CAMNT_0024590065 /DNA_START=41 /DNA_END=589 /DNA_ORIENTATION=-
MMSIVYMLVLAKLCSISLSFVTHRTNIQRKICNLNLAGNADAAIGEYKKSNPSVTPGSRYDVSEKDLVASFNALATALKSETDALEAVKAVPGVLVVPAATMKANFAIYEEKFGFDQAVGVVKRNPNIMQVRTTGYGSAETVGPETVYLSYVVAFTRPIGGFLLAGLAFLLSYPTIAGFLDK